jgi:hypothetical protein
MSSRVIGHQQLHHLYAPAFLYCSFHSLNFESYSTVYHNFHDTYCNVCIRASLSWNAGFSELTRPIPPRWPQCPTPQPTGQRARHCRIVTPRPRYTFVSGRSLTLSTEHP